MYIREEANIMDELLIDTRFIEKIVKNCETQCFEHDENGIINDPYLAEYIDVRVEEIKKMAPDNMTRLIAKKHVYEMNHLCTESEIILGSMFFELCGSIYNYIVKYFYKKDAYHDCVAHLMRHLIEIYHAFLSLMFSDFISACLSHLRILYESYLILRYIMLHKNLSQNYIDHGVVARYRITNGFKSHNTDEDLEVHYKLLIKKYGDDFCLPYGWTAPVIKNKSKRKLSTIAKELGLKDYNSLYILASEIIHSSSFSVNYPIEDMKIFTPINATAIELLSNGIIHFMKGMDVDQKNCLLLMNILYGLREDLYDEPKGLSQTTET